MRRVFVMGAALVALGCPSLDAYHCVEDGDCNRGGVAGRCLVDASCAYPETSGRCDSGWARSPNASSSPNACVDEPSGSTGMQTGSSSSSDASSTSSTSSTDVSSGDMPSTTGPQQCGWAADLSVDTVVFSAGESQRGFVLWVPFKDTDIAGPLSGGDLSLRFLDPRGEVLAHEREDDSMGAPATWLRLPDFDANAVLNLRVELRDDATTPDPADVWSPNWIGVWHLDDAPNGFEDAPVRNSVSPDDVGLMQGAFAPEQSVAGRVGAGLEFDGDDDVVTIDAAFVGTLDDYTISMWTRYDADDPSSRGSYFQRLNGDFFYPRCWRNDGKNNLIICQQEVGEEINSTSASPPPIGEFMHLALVRDSSTAITTLYIDGAYANDFEDPPAALATNDPVYPFELGNGEWGTLPGVIDEVRVSDQVMPPALIQADVRSQIAPGASISWGPLEPLPCP